MKILAIDCSVRGTGVCVFDMSSEKFKLFTYQNKRKKTWEFSTEHFDVLIEQMPKVEVNDYFEEYVGIANRILQYCEPHLKDSADIKVYIEGYAFNKTGKVFNIAEFTALVKKGFYDKGIPISIIEPTVMKKVITGKGNANKTKIAEHLYANDVLYKEVLDVLQDDLNLKLDKSPANDLTDAYALLKTALIKMGGKDEKFVSKKLTNCMKCV